MEKKIVKNLRVLGFPENILPKMKELRKRYLELSFIRHPDKETGTDKAFQELPNAYSEIGKLIDTKPTSRAANAWIKNQHAINRRG